MTIREIKNLHDQAGKLAYDYYADGTIRQWSFRDGSMLQCAVDYSWFAVFMGQNNNRSMRVARMVAS
jgi:hypothetical protein